MAQPGLILPSGEGRLRQPNPRLARRGLFIERGSRRSEPAGPPSKHRRPRHAITLSRPETPTRKGWLIGLILFSLLVHVLFVLGILFVSRHTPNWAETHKADQPPEVTLVLAPSPPAAPRRPSFIPTEPQQNATPQDTPLISDNTTRLQSRNKTSRSDQPLPDVTGQKNHAYDLHSQPASPAVKSQPAPPAPQQPAQPQQQKSAPKPNQATKPAPQNPNATRPVDQPQEGKVVTEIKAKPVDQQYDPNGLPVLPALQAPTLAPQTPQTQPTPQPRRAAPPRSSPSFAVSQSDVTGQVGQPGDSSASANATDLGRYKARVYRAVGSHWYGKLSDNSQTLGTIGVGTVHVSYTIYSDGHLVITADPDANTSALLILHSISINSMTEAAPFGEFSDAMKRQVGDSYSDDFTFSIYGN